MLIRGRLEESFILNHLFWMFGGVLDIINGLCMILSLGFYSTALVCNFSCWRMRRMLARKQ